MFGQLNNRESLRDLIVAFEVHRAKQYHLGLGRNPIAKATPAYANQNRDYRIFEDFAFYIMQYFGKFLPINKNKTIESVLAGSKLH